MYIYFFVTVTAFGETLLEIDDASRTDRLVESDSKWRSNIAQASVR